MCFKACRQIGKRSQGMVCSLAFSTFDFDVGFVGNQIERREPCLLKSKSSVVPVARPDCLSKPSTLNSITTLIPNRSSG